MRWIFSLLLLVNAVYFVWQNPLASVNKSVEVMPENVAGLRLLSEIDASLLLPRGSDGSVVDERSLGGSQVIESLTEGESLEKQSLEIGASGSRSLEKSSLNSGSLENLPGKASQLEISAADEPFVLLNMLVEEQSVAGQSATGSPVTDSLVIDSLVIDGPVIDSPVIDSPVIDSPVIDSPVIDSPVIDGPVIDGPVIDGLVIDSPVIDGPVIDGPVIDSPVIDSPVTDDPVIDNPVTEQWCQVVSGLNDEGEARQLLDEFEKAGLTAEVKVSEEEVVLAFELIMDKPTTAGDNALLRDDFDRLDMHPQELLLKGMAVYVLGRFGSGSEVDEALSRLEGELAPRVYQVVSKVSYFEVWVASDEEAETSNKINLLASYFSPEIKIEKKYCKGVASTEARD